MSTPRPSAARLAEIAVLVKEERALNGLDARDLLAEIDAAIVAENIDAHLAGEPVDTIQTVSPQIATKADFVTAFQNYGLKYDGEKDDPTKMVFTKEDITKIFSQVFGEKVTSLASMPGQTPENFGKLVAAIERATAENPFRRAVK